MAFKYLGLTLFNSMESFKTALRTRLILKVEETRVVQTASIMFTELPEGPDVSAVTE